MLEKIDLKGLFNASQEAHQPGAFFYAEQREEKILEFMGRQQRSRLHYEEGTRFETGGESARKILTSESISSVPTPYDLVGLQNLVTERNRLEQLIRKAAFDLDASPSPTLRYTEMKRKFLASSGPEKSQLDQDSFAQIEVRFLCGGKTVSISRCRHNIEALWKEMESDPLFLDPALKKGWENPWPAPQGKLPVLWSAESTSKLILPLLKGLPPSSQWQKPAPIRFELEDKPDRTYSKADQSGTIRSQQKLVENGLPTNLLLGQKGSGLVRRMHYLGESAQGFWNVTLSSEFRKDKLLKDLQMGVFVGDLEVEAFDPRSTEMLLTLTNACLIHHGELGEAILPITLKSSLLDLFSSWETFSTSLRTYGYWISKPGCRFITEITAPEAFSREFFLPGSVSPSHYW